MGLIVDVGLGLQIGKLRRESQEVFRFLHGWLGLGLLSQQISYLFNPTWFSAVQFHLVFRHQSPQLPSKARTVGVVTRHFSDVFDPLSLRRSFTTDHCLRHQGSCNDPLSVALAMNDDSDHSSSTQIVIRNSTTPIVRMHARHSSSKLLTTSF